MKRTSVAGIAIYPDNRIEEVELTELEDYQAIVQGWIEPVGLEDGSTMYVNEEFLLGQFGPEDFNSIASDLDLLIGRRYLPSYGILGPVVCVGPVDDEGESTDVTDFVRDRIRKIGHEAGAKISSETSPSDLTNGKEALD